MLVPLSRALRDVTGPRFKRREIREKSGFNVFEGGILSSFFSLHKLILLLFLFQHEMISSSSVYGKILFHQLLSPGR